MWIKKKTGGKKSDWDLQKPCLKKVQHTFVQSVIEQLLLSGAVVLNLFYWFSESFSAGIALNSFFFSALGFPVPLVLNQMSLKLESVGHVVNSLPSGCC